MITLIVFIILFRKLAYILFFNCGLFYCIAYQSYHSLSNIQALQHQSGASDDFQESEEKTVPKRQYDMDAAMEDKIPQSKEGATSDDEQPNTGFESGWYAKLRPIHICACLLILLANSRWWAASLAPSSCHDKNAAFKVLQTESKYDARDE